MSISSRDHAIQLHGDQRYGEEPYVFHLDAVVRVLADFGFTDQHWIDAGYLHDAPEDVAPTVAAKLEMMDELDDMYPALACDLIYAVTGIGDNRKARNASIYENISEFPIAAILKLADRIANVENSDLNFHAMYLKELPIFEENIRPHVEPEMWYRLIRAFERNKSA